MWISSNFGFSHPIIYLLILWAPKFFFFSVMWANSISPKLMFRSIKQDDVQFCFCCGEIHFCGTPDWKHVVCGLFGRHDIRTHCNRLVWFAISVTRPRNWSTTHWQTPVCRLLLLRWRETPWVITLCLR